MVTEEYAVSKDGMKMFGVLDLDTGMVSRAAATFRWPASIAAGKLDTGSLIDLKDEW